MMEECKRLQVENGFLVQKICGILVLEMGGVYVVVVDVGDVVFVGGENEVVLLVKEIEELQNDGNGNIMKLKEGKFVGRVKNIYKCV